ncbi:MAG: adenosine kinase [Chlamydiota bacterium]|nr:adenosine kinase [Chlamydiota bacterium]
MTQKANYDILGIGAPIVDHIIRVSEDFIQQLDGGKGGMVMIDHDTLSKLLADLGGEASLIAGGSCSNTIKGLTRFGNRCALWGKVGKDPSRLVFTESLKEQGVTPLMLTSDTPTGHAVCLITPDGERTMRTYFGASLEMTDKDLDPSIFNDIKHLHLEGYNFFKENLVEESIKLAKSAGATISLDLASYEIVNMFKDRIIDILKNGVDIVIANADEAWSLTGLPPEASCHTLKDLCDTAVVLFGEGGCWVGQDNEVIHGAAFPTEPVDTTGAGDLFASGFIHGYLQNLPLPECARLGNLAGSAVVQVLGAEIPPVAWEHIRTGSHIKIDAIS